MDGCVTELLAESKRKVRALWESLASTRLHNQDKVLRAFRQARVGTHCFGDSSGYGYHDAGRDALEAVYQSAFQAEAALVRPQIVSGTHAIYLCLCLLQPGDELVSISGPPYDTLQQVIGTSGDSAFSLIKRGVCYHEIPLTDEGRLDFEVLSRLPSSTKMVMLQRSRGYSWRPAIGIGEISRAVSTIQSVNPDCIVFVDNCYGEFVETREPTEVGVDLMAGSLIKNPGGTLASSGGYILGRRDLVEACGEYLTAPGIGAKVGPTFGTVRQLMQGFFQAPHVVGEALHGAMLVAQVFGDLGYRVSPHPDEPRSDLIQAIALGSEERLLSFCRGIQRASPVDAHFTPIPDEMPGYDDRIVMAGGTFIQGASLELSADAPIKDPYIVYFQGGLCVEHVELAIQSVLKEMGPNYRYA